MDLPKKYIHDRLVLLYLTIMAALLTIGISTVFVRFDILKNPTTITAYRPSFSGSVYSYGGPVDIYALAIFMAIIAISALALSIRMYSLRRALAIFILASTNFLLLLSAIVANALISLQ